MEQELISKKELLELTGISYGQLYRWKRKNLIPEEWFIRKSTFTGQETFFPKDKILARLDKIKDMKDDLSLDELADVFSPNPAVTSLPKQELMQRNIVSQMSLDLFVKQYGDRDVFGFDQMLYVYILDRLLQTGEMSLDEGKMLLQVMTAHYPSFAGKPCDVVLLRKMGISTLMLLQSGTDAYFDSASKLVVRLNVANSQEELKVKVSEWGNV